MDIQLPLWVDDTHWSDAKKRHPRLYKTLKSLSDKIVSDEDIDDEEYYHILEQMSDIRERMMK